MARGGFPPLVRGQMTEAGAAARCAPLERNNPPSLTNILFIGDIFASPGRTIVARHLKDIVAAENIDLAIANVENAAGGFGITPQLAEDLFGIGLDVLTTGNHVWDKREIYDYFAREPRLLRPANYNDELPGRGFVVVEARSGVHWAIMN